MERDTASLGWRHVMLGGGTFDVTSDHPNKKGWDIFELGQRSFWAVPTAVAFVLMGAWFEVRFLAGAVSSLAVSHVFFGAIVLGWVLVRAIEAQRLLWTKNLPIRVSSQ